MNLLVELQQQSPMWPLMKWTTHRTVNQPKSCFLRTLRREINWTVVTTLLKRAVFDGTTRPSTAQEGHLKILYFIFFGACVFVLYQKWTNEDMLAESLKGLPNHRCPNRQCYAKTSRISTQRPFAISQWGPGRTKTQIHMTRVLSLIHLDYLSSPQISSDTGGISHMFPFPQIWLGSLIWSYDFGFCSLQQSFFLILSKNSSRKMRLGNLS